MSVKDLKEHFDETAPFIGFVIDSIVAVLFFIGFPVGFVFGAVWSGISNGFKAGKLW